MNETIISGKRRRGSVFLSRGAQVGPDAAVAGRKIGVTSRRSRWRFLWEWVDSKSLDLETWRKAIKRGRVDHSRPNKTYRNMGESKSLDMS